MGHTISMCSEEDNYADVEELEYGDWLRSESTGRSQARSGVVIWEEERLFCLVEVVVIDLGE